MGTLFLITAKFSAKREDDRRSQYNCLPLNLQPSEGMRCGHSFFLLTATFSDKRGDESRSQYNGLTLNFQPSEGMTINHSTIVYHSILAKQGDEMRKKYLENLPIIFNNCGKVRLYNNTGMEIPNNINSKILFGRKQTTFICHA